MVESFSSSDCGGASAASAGALLILLIIINPAAAAVAAASDSCTVSPALWALPGRGSERSDDGDVDDGDETTAPRSMDRSNAPSVPAATSVTALWW